VRRASAPIGCGGGRITYQRQAAVGVRRGSHGHGRTQYWQRQHAGRFNRQHLATPRLRPTRWCGQWHIAAPVATVRPGVACLPAVPILTLIQQRPPVFSLLLAVAGLVIFVACYTAIMWSHPLGLEAHRRWSFGSALALLLALVALVLVLSLTYGSTFLWLLVGVSAMAGVLLSPRGAFLAVMGVDAAHAWECRGMAGGLNAADWLHIVPLALLVRGLGLDMTGLSRLAGALREVHAARGELARLAVMEERLRMARDLHDLLGQSLAMITLKASWPRAWSPRIRRERLRRCARSSRLPARLYARCAWPSPARGSRRCKVSWRARGSCWRRPGSRIRLNRLPKHCQSRSMRC